MTLVQNITQLTRYLPSKDVFYAEAFILRRDFVSLKELVDSAIKRVVKNYDRATPKKDLLDADVEKLMELALAVDEYLALLGEEIEESEDDENEEEFVDEW